MNYHFEPYDDRDRVYTMQACERLGCVRTTLGTYAKALGIVQVRPKVGKPFYWGKDINRIGLRRS